MWKLFMIESTAPFFFLTFTHIEGNIVSLMNVGVLLLKCKQIYSVLLKLVKYCATVCCCFLGTQQVRRDSTALPQLITEVPRELFWCMISPRRKHLTIYQNGWKWLIRYALSIFFLHAFFNKHFFSLKEIYIIHLGLINYCQLIFSDVF